tara:strand:- start:3112 stop:3501 length:390 start_codon:yes stop_codon:yes gene_type:complete
MISYNKFMSAKEKLTFEVDGETFGNFKLREGDRRMKLYIKLNKEETAQWEQLKTAMTGGQLSNDVFARILFFKGIHSITQELNERVENMTEEEKQQILDSMSEKQVEKAMEMAEEEFGDNNEDSAKDNN